MKTKKYIKPEIKVISVETQSILAGSAYDLTRKDKLEIDYDEYSDLTAD